MPNSPPKEAHDVPPSFASPADQSRPREGGQHQPQRRKLRPLIITISGPRQSHLTEMFSHPRLAAHFDPPAFSPGVPVRSIRNCRNLLSKANEAGLLPEAEWEALATTGTELWETNPIRYLDALTDPTQPGSSQKVCPDPVIPIAPGRHGSQRDRKLHYSVELWWKSKSISRERGVLACLLAHLIAMRALVEGDYDLILEDNVRAPIVGGEGGKDEVEAEVDAYCECAERIWATMEASERLSNASKEQDEANANEEKEGSTSKECHLRYYGWLGSKPNLKWLYETHMPRMRARTDFDEGGGGISCRQAGAQAVFLYIGQRREEE